MELTGGTNSLLWKVNTAWVKDQQQLGEKWGRGHTVDLQVYGKEIGMTLKCVEDSHFSLYVKCLLKMVPGFPFTYETSSGRKTWRALSGWHSGRVSGVQINIAQCLPQGFNPTILNLGTHTVHLHKRRPTMYKVSHNNSVTLRKMSLNISRRILHSVMA